MILEEVENLINESTAVDAAKSGILGYLGGESSSNVLNHYVRKELKKHDISVTPDEADELIKNRSKKSMMFGVPTAIIGSILGSAVGHPYLGAIGGAAIGGTIGKTIANDKFINDKRMNHKK